MMRSNGLAEVILLFAATFITTDGSNLQKRLEKPLCSNLPSGYHPYPKDCKRYIYCSGDNAYVFKCLTGMNFDAYEKICTRTAKCASSFKSKFRSQLRSSSSSSKRSCKRIVCFVNTGSRNRYGAGRFRPKDIDATLCTHIIYGYASITNNRIAFPYEEDIRQMMAKKEKNPDLKVMLSVGGWDGSGGFNHMVGTNLRRTAFIANAIWFLRTLDFDGLAIDWIYPVSRGLPSHNKQRFIYLLRDLRMAFEVESVPNGKSKLVLSASGAPTNFRIDKDYDVPEMNKYLDFIVLMSYNYNGPWDRKTGHVSPIWRVKRSVQLWRQRGASASKLVIAIPFFARTFTLKDRNLFGYHMDAGYGDMGPYTKEMGTLAYYEVCPIIKKAGVIERLHNIDDRYLVDGDQWIGYDDKVSIWKKVSYTMAEYTGGVLLMDISLDDFSGDFCGNGKFPLLRKVNCVCNLR